MQSSFALKIRFLDLYENPQYAVGKPEHSAEEFSSCGDIYTSSFNLLQFIVVFCLGLDIR